MTQDEYFEHEAAKAPKPSSKILVDREDLALLIDAASATCAVEFIQDMRAKLNGGAQ